MTDRPDLTAAASRAAARQANLRARVGWWLRTLADRIDYPGAPKSTGWSFTFERNEGVRFRDDGRGCPVWYLGDAAYRRAHDEADSAAYPQERRRP